MVAIGLYSRSSSTGCPIHSIAIGIAITVVVVFVVETGSSTVLVVVLSKCNDVYRLRDQKVTHIYRRVRIPTGGREPLSLDGCAH